MFLYIGYHAVVVRNILAVQRMILRNTVINCIIATSVHMIEVAVTLANNSFPNQGLCSHHVRHLICISCILRSPFSCNRAGISVLENTTDKQLDFVCRNCFVVGRGIIIPVVFVTRRHHITDVQRRTGLDTVACRTIPGANRVCGDFTGRTCRPTIHIVKLRMTPVAAIICVTFTREGHHYNGVGFTGFSGKGGCGTHAYHSRKAHQHCKKCRHTFLENAFLQGKFLLLT